MNGWSASQPSCVLVSPVLVPPNPMCTTRLLYSRGPHLWDMPLRHEGGTPLCMGMQSLSGSPHVPVLGS